MHVARCLLLPVGQQASRAAAAGAGRQAGRVQRSCCVLCFARPATWPGREPAQTGSLGTPPPFLAGLPRQQERAPGHIKGRLSAHPLQYHTLHTTLSLPPTQLPLLTPSPATPATHTMAPKKAAAAKEVVEPVEEAPKEAKVRRKG